MLQLVRGDGTHFFFTMEYAWSAYTSGGPTAMPTDASTDIHAGTMMHSTVVRGRRTEATWTAAVRPGVLTAWLRRASRWRHVHVAITWNARDRVPPQKSGEQLYSSIVQIMLDHIAMSLLETYLWPSVYVSASQFIYGNLRKHGNSEANSRQVTA